MNRRNFVFLITLVIGTAIDQLTKWWVIQNLRPRGVPMAQLEDWQRELPQRIELIPGWLDFVHAQNPGAAFSMFADFEYRHYMFLGFTVIATVIVLDLVRRLPSRDVFMAMTLGLILSGAFGNAIDRVVQQVVTDFIRVYTEIPSWETWLRSQFGTSEWPSFNIADANLVVGVLLFLIYTTFFDDTKEIPEEASPPDASVEPPSPEEMPTEEDEPVPTAGA